MDKEREESARRPLAEALEGLDRGEICALFVRICRQVQAESGTAHWHGGLYPDNIDVEGESVVIGPVSGEGWADPELDFLAPELYWNGEKSPAADVYALGLLLYTAVSGGRLPFGRPGNRRARERRLKGDGFRVPEGAGRRLAEIIGKATAFQANERYQSVEELRAALVSCVNNIYIDGSAEAETLFHKSEDELSPVERMMLDILKKEEDPDLEKAPEEPEEPEEEEEAIPEEKSAENTAEEKSEEKPAESEDKPDEPEVPEDFPVVILTEEKNPELEPVVVKRTPVQYQNSVAREKTIAKKVRRRRLRPILLFLLLSLLLVGAALYYRNVILMQESPEGTAAEATPLPAETLQPEQGSVPAPQTTPETVETTPDPTPEPTPVPLEHSYHVFVDDVDWVEARDRSVNAGGYLVVIDDKAEFDRVTALLDEQGVTFAWVGCRRIEGDLKWVKETNGGYIVWADDEPSYSWAGVAEDYIMLTKDSGEWRYNDINRDPFEYYYYTYTGRVAYVIEFEG
ncbi:MAG: hypothetical protein K6G17_07660 [Oscillospiraceae bacterium]|nr:hypothetical protein [Oscillospiraceae bacterium]